jgi:hypothetical protein
VRDNDTALIVSVSWLFCDKNGVPGLIGLILERKFHLKKRVQHGTIYRPGLAHSTRQKIL